MAQGAGTAATAAAAAGGGGAGGEGAGGGGAGGGGAGGEGAATCEVLPYPVERVDWHERSELLQAPYISPYLPISPYISLPISPYISLYLPVAGLARALRAAAGRPATTYYLQLTTYYLLLTIYYLLPTADYVLLLLRAAAGAPPLHTYRLLPTTYYLLLPISSGRRCPSSHWSGLP